MNMNGRGQDILWTDIQKLFDVESRSLALYQSGLTLAHVNLNPRSKVGLDDAPVIFHWAEM